MSQLGSDTAFALRKSIDDILANDASPPAFMSRSQSLIAASRAQSEPRGVTTGEALVNASTALRPSAAPMKPAPSTWSRSSYPGSANRMETDRGVKQLENVSGRADVLSLSSASPGNGVSSTEASHDGDGAITDALESTTTGWSRRGYPLQQHQGDTKIAENGMKKAHQPDVSPRSMFLQHGQDLATRQQRQELTDEGQHLAGLTQAGHSHTSPTTQERRLSRSTYSLQNSLINDTAERYEPNMEAAQQARQRSIKGDQESSEYTRRSHHGYPLQSPASILHLRGPPTPPDSSDENRSEDSLDEPSTLKLEHEPPARATPPGNRSRFSKRTYPMQHLPSHANLRSPPTPDQQAPYPRSIPDGRARGKSLIRGTYPLQHLPSLMNMRHNAYSTGSAAGRNQGDFSEEDNSILAGKHFSFASKLESKTAAVPPPSPQSQTETNTSHNDVPAPPSSQQWRRGVYPLQGADSFPSTKGITLPPTQQNLPWHQPNLKQTTKHPPAVQRQYIFQNTCALRTIVVCLDGTGDKFDSDNSNIVQLVSALKKDDPDQVSYYQAGIGTYNQAGGLSSGFSSALDMAVGSDLGLHVRDAYQFLMHSYKEGDKICIFGFSRGAYTARCVAGMVHKVGLLPPRNYQQIPFAYEFYADSSENGWTQSRLFKQTFSIDVSVYFLGAFDSVGSIGFIPRQLPLSTTPTNKSRYFRHAMALDERRAKFKVCRYETAKDLDHKDHIDKDADDADDKGASDQPWNPSQTPYGPDYHPNVTSDEYNALTEPSAVFDTDVKEVWFAGCHADVGGGAVLNSERHKLSQIPLRWMIRQCFECDTGIKFKTRHLAEFGLDVHTLWPTYRNLEVPSLHGPPPSFLEKWKELPSREVRKGKLVSLGHDKQHALAKKAHEESQDRHEHLLHLKSTEDDDWTPEQVEDYYDSLAPLNDQLVDAPNWWILELWPVEVKIPKGNGEVERRTMANWGRYRGVGDRAPLLHWTVKQRMSSRPDYTVRVRTAKNCRWKVVV
ncbi:uncharacterized protein AB675_5175 [Cyphellophora attinorum]|uniref:T6SS Phospholipase effector Tle1-like catalytic domain-containing protein n=1 Tax=Cyphellophora attinorum TaxID=1664694 RepID=A0A0N0NLM5_9EURO|nr:uncharacterized protein AB675_5175 [Phialophora attinorum]KPI39209.1 hypothetical protein AB675_5175 [Phialophora attinorum]